MAFTEDFDVFLDEDGFAVSAVLGASTVSVIFDRVWIETQGAGATQPVCQGKTSDLGAATHGTAITIGGTAYNVIDNQPDGTGMTTLVLQLA